jgi:hypothetical protein
MDFGWGFFWITTTSPHVTGIMVGRGNYPTMALFESSELSSWIIAVFAVSPFSDIFPAAVVETQHDRTEAVPEEQCIWGRGWDGHGSRVIGQIKTKPTGCGWKWGMPATVQEKKAKGYLMSLSQYDGPQIHAPCSAALFCKGNRAWICANRFWGSSKKCVQPCSSIWIQYLPTLPC